MEVARKVTNEPASLWLCPYRLICVDIGWTSSADKYLVSNFNPFCADYVSSSWKWSRFSHLISTAPTKSANLQVIWSSYTPTWSKIWRTLGPRKSLVFSIPQLIDDHPRLDTASSCFFLADNVSQKVWPSLISIYHRGAYPQILLSFLALCEKHKNVLWLVSIYIWMPW